jgi:transcriptional regulator with XRE-family HTH domain
MLDFNLATHEEIAIELGARLKTQRLIQLMSREELAARAGVSRGTVRNLELKGQSSIDSVLRIALTLGLADQLQTLFMSQTKSILEMERAEKAIRLRAPKKAIR